MSASGPQTGGSDPLPAPVLRGRAVSPRRPRGVGGEERSVRQRGRLRRRAALGRCGRRGELGGLGVVADAAAGRPAHRVVLVVEHGSAGLGGVQAVLLAGLLDRAVGPGCVTAEVGQLLLVEEGGGLEADRRGPGRVADEVAERRVDLVGGLQGRGRAGRVGVEHALADRVEGTGYAGADLPRPQRPAVLRRGVRDGGAVGARPASDEAGVEEGGEVDHVGLVLAERPSAGDPGLVAAAQDGVDHESDQLDRAGLGDHDVLGEQPAVGDPVPVGGADRLGDLLDHPGGPAGRERALGEQPVEGDPVSPLVDDVGDAVLGGGVEHAQQVTVADGGRGAGRVEQRLAARVLGRDDVDRDAPGEGPVGGTPEAGPLVVVEQVLEHETSGEKGARSDGCLGHAPPSSGRTTLLGIPTMLRGRETRSHLPRRLVTRRATLVTSSIRSARLSAR